MKNLSLALFLLFLSVFSLFGQKTKLSSKVAEKPSGVISGTISDETGAAVEDVEISINAVGSSKISAYFRDTTDRAGKFRFENLKTRRYKIFVRVAGYVLPEMFETSPERQKTYRINQELNLTVRKGGVITGKVLDENGQPLIKLRVRAMRIRDEFGQKIPAQEFEQYSLQHFTDDRGIYRIFGLTAGSYLIFIGGDHYFSERNLKTKEGSPVYHPSDSVDTAREIRVGFGQEINSVDINFRLIQGFRVSGTILGAKPNAGNNGSVSISLVDAVNGVPIVQTQMTELDGKYAFQIEHIPDGEYEIRALQFNDGGIFSKNSLQKVKIKGADVSGLTINLKSLNSIEGKVSIEKNVALATVKECPKTAETAVTSMLISFDSDAKEKSVVDSLERNQQNALAAPEENGDFEINQLASSKYFLKVNFLDANLYIKEIFQQISAKEKRDLSGGVNLQNSANVENVRIVFGDGATKINGKIIVSDEENIKNQSAKFIVYLIPSEAENKDKILRYALSFSNSDASFSFENIAPGNYFLMAEDYSLDKEKLQESAIPKFWDTKERLELWQKVKNEETALTLKPCQNSTVDIKIKNSR